MFGAKVQYQDPALAFLTYDEEHHRFAFANMDLIDPGGGGPDDRGVIGVDHVAYTCASLIGSLRASTRQLKADGITPYWCIHHGITVSMYYGDPDGNQMEFQVDCFADNDDANTFMRRAFSTNPIGVEYEPEEWLVEIRSGTPVEDLLDARVICRCRRFALPSGRDSAHPGAERYRPTPDRHRLDA